MSRPKTRFQLADPVVIRLPGRKKKRRKYSAGLKDAQVMERHLTRASQRMVRALDAGLTDYRKARKKSARKKQDGALVDFVPNTARAMSRSLRLAAPVPLDLARAASTPTARRLVRRQIRFTSKLTQNFIR